MIKNRKTVKGKLGKTRPKDTDFAGIARKQSRNKKTTTKSNRPTDARTKALRTALKEKQKLAGKGLGQAGQAFLEDLQDRHQFLQRKNQQVER